MTKNQDRTRKKEEKTYKMPLEFNRDNLTAQIYTNVGVTDKWEVGIDTGFEVSLIKISSLRPGTAINTQEKIALAEAWGES